MKTRTMRIAEALMTFSILVGIISLTLVEKQPLVLCVTAMAFVLYLGAWNLKAEEQLIIRSNADEDRPE